MNYSISTPCNTCKCTLENLQKARALPMNFCNMKVKMFSLVLFSMIGILGENVLQRVVVVFKVERGIVFMVKWETLDAKAQQMKHVLAPFL